MMSFLDAEHVELGDSMLGQSGSSVWKARTGKGGKCGVQLLGSQISKIELSSVIPTRSNTAPAAAGGDGGGGHTPAPLVRRRAQEVGRQRCRRPRVVPIHCTVERAPLGHGRRAPRMAGGGSTCGPHSAWPGYMCCRACTAESTAPRSTVHLKRIPEGPCAMARRRHGAHRRHGALGARRPSSAALRVNDPRTISKVVCPRPPRTSRCCSAVPVAVEAQPRASTAGKSSNLERRGRANVQVRAAELLAFLLTEQHYRWCNCMC
jgi:hypothetical protein